MKLLFSLHTRSHSWNHFCYASVSFLCWKLMNQLYGRFWEKKQRHRQRFFLQHWICFSYCCTANWQQRGKTLQLHRIRSFGLFLLRAFFVPPRGKQHIVFGNISWSSLEFIGFLSLCFMYFCCWWFCNNPISHSPEGMSAGFREKSPFFAVFYPEYFITDSLIFRDIIFTHFHFLFFFCNFLYYFLHSSGYCFIHFNTSIYPK